mmetsp:Transcript_21843/g.67516  ORF Transcript_21843/g.67516 Transcript_21843/m.67516 type:complete len:234 (+) Transcript_21843:2244-2945(+)
MRAASVRLHGFPRSVFRTCRLVNESCEKTLCAVALSGECTNETLRMVALFVKEVPIMVTPLPARLKRNQSAMANIVVRGTEAPPARTMSPCCCQLALKDEWPRSPSTLTRTKPAGSAARTAGNIMGASALRKNAVVVTPSPPAATECVEATASAQSTKAVTVTPPSLPPPHAAGISLARSTPFAADSRAMTVSSDFKSYRKPSNAAGAGAGRGTCSSDGRRQCAVASTYPVRA